MLPKLPALKKVFQDRDLPPTEEQKKTSWRGSYSNPQIFHQQNVKMLQKKNLFTVLQIQLKSLQESCTFLKWGRAQEMLCEGLRCHLGKSSAGTGKGFKAETTRGPDDAIDVKNTLEIIRNQS